MYTESCTVVCPICRQRTNKPFEDLPKNRYIIQYLDNFKRNAPSSANTQIQANNLPMAATATSRFPLQPTTSTSSSSSWDLREYYQLVFIQIDEDNDGFVTSAELSQGLHRGSFVSEFVDEDKLRRVFNKHDRDRDNRLNFEEFLQMITDINENYAELLLSHTNNTNGSNSNPHQGNNRNQSRLAPIISGQYVANNNNNNNNGIYQPTNDDQRYLSNF